MIDFSQFHFLRPLWFLLLLPLLFLFSRARHRQSLTNAWHKVVDSHLLQHMFHLSKKQQSVFIPVLFLLSGIAMTFALAGPTWQKLPQPVFKYQAAKVFVLDLSQSMSAADVTPSRLVRVKLKLMDMLRNSKEGQSALIAYAGDAFVVSPLTDDAHTVMNLVPTLSPDLMPVQGSNAALALLKAQQLLSQAGVPSGDIILLSDGVNDEASTVASQLAEAGHRLHVLAVGTEQGAPIGLDNGGFLKDRQGNIVIPKLDRASLTTLAKNGNGEYAELTVDDSDVQRLMKKHSQLEAGSDFEKSDRQLDLWRDEGYWLLVLVLPLALFLFRRGWIVVVLLGVLPLYPTDSWALSWDELWLNRDQRGQQLLESKKFKDAAKTFGSKEWQANALYRAGEYEKAASLYQSLEGVDNRYNQANALARSSKLQEALSAYEEVLKQNPDHEDAKANHDLVKKLLDQQQKQEDKQQDSQQGNEDSEQQDQNAENGQGENSQEKDKQEQNQSSSDDAASNDSEKQNQPQNSEKKEQSQAQESKDKQDQADEEQSATAENEKQGDEKTDSAEPREELSAEQKEQKQALEQWLRRIPDDPGGLLRQKFLLQHRQQQQQTTETEEPW